MEALHHPYISVGYTRESRKSIFRQFFDWCTNQEKNHVLWLALIITGHGCIITPFTVLILAFSVNSMLLWALAIAAMGMSMVTNLAAMPTRITIPVFVLSLVLDLVVIISCIAAGLPGIAG